MTNHPNRGWRGRWTVDIEAASAAHGGGLIVDFAPGLAQPPPPIGTLAYTSDGREWTGTLRGGEEAAQQWLKLSTQAALRDQRSIEGRIARLMREAGQVWASAKNREH